MKKDEQKLLKNFQESLEQNKTFEDIQNNIVFKNQEASKRVFWTPKKIGFSLTGGLALILIAILIPLLFLSSNSAKVTSIRISNRQDLLVIYEKNCSFISSGVLVDKEMSDGTVVQAKSEEVVVDYEKFAASKVGRYHISVYLKAYPDIKTGYEVSVVDDEIIGLNLIEFRNTYYLGEQITSEDLVLEKELASGNKKRVKLTEVSIDSKGSEANRTGKHDVEVVLNSNQDFRLSYTVDVKPIEELDLSGKYGYTDDFSSRYSFDVLAIEIIDDYAKSYDSEVVISGTLKKEVSNNEIIISDFKHNQKMIYKPFTEQLIIKGIAGDPDMLCFKLVEGDYLISLTGPLVEGNRIFIARNGQLSTSSLLYLKQSYGGAYLDASLEFPIDSDTKFEKDTLIHVQGKPILNDQKEYMGIWYDKGVVALELNEAGLYIGGRVYTTPYTLEKSFYGYRIRISAYEVYEYNLLKDTIDLYLEGNYYATYQRYNPETQVIATAYPTTSRIQWVLNKGDTLKTMDIRRNDIQYYRIPNYNNEPIYENVDFGKIVQAMWGISDMGSYLYGTVENYVIIKGSWGAGKPTIDLQSTYYLEVYKDYELVEVGWIELINSVDDDITILVHLEDGATEELQYNRKTRIILYKGESFKYNETSCKGFEYVGEYVGSDGSSKTIDEAGRVSYEIYYPSGYVARGTHTTYIKSWNESSIMLWYIYQNAKDEREIRTIELKKENEIWSFVYDGITYSKTDASQSE